MGDKLRPIRVPPADARHSLLRPADNPFRVERVHGVEYLPQGDTWPALMRRLARLRFRAAVVGPHGSGKTTLLRSLAPGLEALGLRTRTLFRNAEGGGGMPPGWRAVLEDVQDADVLLVDGYNHLGPLPRLRLRLLVRRAGPRAGLVVTSHARCDLPTLVRTSTSPALLRTIVSRLIPDPMDEATAANLLARHRGNLREALRELYDDAALPTPLPPGGLGSG